MQETLPNSFKINVNTPILSQNESLLLGVSNPVIQFHHSEKWEVYMQDLANSL